MRTFPRMLAVMIVVPENPAAAQLKGTHLPGDAVLYHFTGASAISSCVHTTPDPSPDNFPL